MHKCYVFSEKQQETDLEVSAKFQKMESKFIQAESFDFMTMCSIQYFSKKH